VATIVAVPALRAQEKDACGKPMTAEKIAQRALDYAEINNVAGAHEYYHSAFKHQEELDDIWSKREDIAWQNGSDFYKSRTSVENFYGKGIKQANPHGALWYHMLTTPIVEVAGDGQTAKAIWMSFGNVTGAGPGGGASMQWTEEKYGMDFIKENGKWKIWHLRTYVEFYTPYEKGWALSNMSAPAGAVNAMQMGGAPPSGGQGQQAGAPPQGAGAPPQGKDTGATVKQEPGANMTGDLMKPDEKGDYYIGYYPDRPAPAFDPVPPAAYCTWKDTKGYVQN
jgi:hypothetical protein